jgi:hypothetical protein
MASTRTFFRRVLWILRETATFPGAFVRGFRKGFERSMATTRDHGYEAAVQQKRADRVRLKAEMKEALHLTAMALKHIDHDPTRFIIRERGPPPALLDTLVHMKAVTYKGVNLRPEEAAEIVMAAANGDFGAAYHRVPRDHPEACLDVFGPPIGLAEIAAPDQDGGLRPDVIERLLGKCTYVTTLKRLPKAE